MNASSAAVNVVLVHGAFADGSGWRPVYDLLAQDGYHVAVVQNPTVSLQGDVAATRLIIDAQDGPVVLVGHSYGGAVITEAGTHPNVAALIYISAFAPDKDESVKTLISGFPADTPQMPGLPPRDGFIFQDPAKFHASFGADLPAGLAAFMVDSEVPLGRGRCRRDGHRSRLADQAELVHDRHRGPGDPPSGPAHHVPAGRVDRSGSGGQSRRLHHEPGPVADLIKQAASAVAAQQ